MFAMIVQFASSVRALLQHAPTNRFVRRLRRRPRVVGAVMAMLAGVAYVFAAAICTVLLDRGAPGALNLVVLLFIYNGLKLALHGLAMLAVLARDRLRSAGWWRARSPRVVPSRTTDRPYTP